MRCLAFAAVTVAVLVAFTPAEAQRARQFGEVEAKSIAARDAGIGGLRLQREGPEDTQAEWLVTAEALDLSGELLGVLEMRFPSEHREVFSFIRADESATYRVIVDVSDGPYYELEHVGVEKFRMRPTCDSNELVPKGKWGWTEEELEALREEMLECSKQVEITGTSKSFEEILGEYQEVTDFLAALATEVRNFLGIPAKRHRRVPEKRDHSKPTTGRMETPGSTDPPGILKITCGQGQYKECSYPSTTYAVVGTGDCFFCDQTECCTEASQDAEFECQVRTAEGCCANSFCTVTSASGCGAWCRCQLIGDPFLCYGPPC